MRYSSLFLLASGACCAAAFSALANPVGGNVSAGQAVIQDSGSTLSVTQHSDKAVIDWRGFDIAPHETTRFVQPSSSSIIVNRVNSDRFSSIDGTLSANGTVVIVNPNGVMFGSSAKVDVNGLIASTADIDNADVMNSHGPLSFQKPGQPDAAIVNNGTITAREAGLVGFVAPRVVNNGQIVAKMGRVHLASGDTATVDMYGDGLMEVAVSDRVTSQLVANDGIIQADGGKVALTAAAGGQIVNSLITNGGVLQAQSVAQEKGEIVIFAEGSNAVAQNVAANKGIKSGNSHVLVAGVLDASGRAEGEAGGAITVTGDQVALLKGTLIDASGSSSSQGRTGGEVLIGGDYLGQGTVPAAKNLYVDEAAVVFNDALDAGDAGRNIFWSDGTTAFHGQVFARALGTSGNGGFVETSGHENLQADGFVDLRSRYGQRGTYFLDPANITIYGNVTPAFVSSDGTLNLAGALKLWLDASDPNNVVLTYNSLGSTASGSSGSNVLTVSSAASLVVGARVRLGGAGSVTAASTVGADTYTISAINGTQVTLSSALTRAYSSSAVYEGYISQLTDKSGSGNSGTQATASRMPLWVSNGQNGQGVASFDGTVRYLSSPLTTTTATFFLLSGQNSNSAAYYFDGATSGNRQALGFTLNGQSGYIGLYSGSVVQAADTSTSFRIYGAKFAAAAALGINGAQVLSGNSGNSVLNGLIIGERYSATSLNALNGKIGEFINYSSTPTGSTLDLLYQYQSGKWGVALTAPGTGATEVAKATASDGYSVFTTRYLERLSASANISLQATNNIKLDLQGDTLNFTTANRSLTLTAGNQITTGSTGRITTQGGNVSLTATNGIVLSHAIDLVTNGGNLSFNNAVTLGAAQSWDAGVGSISFGGTVNGNANLTARAGSFSFAAPVGGTTPLSAVSLTSVNDLSLPSVRAASLFAQTTGSSANLTLPTNSVLSLSGAGTAATLVTAHSFINNSGSNAMTMSGGGRWLIYSASPGIDVFNGLDSAATAVWNTVYGGSVTASGNRYVFAYQPTVAFASVDDSKAYGTDSTAAVATDYSVSGLQAGVAQAFLGDSNATAFTGTPSVVSTGSAATAHVSGGPYAISLSAGTLAALNGYALVPSSPGKLTVTQAPLTVTADSQTITHGDILPALTASYSGFVNGDTAAQLTVLPVVTSLVAAHAPAGVYLGTLAANGGVSGDYSFVYVPGDLTIRAVSGGLAAQQFFTSGTGSVASDNVALTVDSSTMHNLLPTLADRDDSVSLQQDSFYPLLLIDPALAVHLALSNTALGNMPTGRN